MESEAISKFMSTSNPGLLLDSDFDLVNYLLQKNNPQKKKC
jgi:hypothetical protein